LSRSAAAESGQTVAVNHPAGAFQANHHLIARFRRRQYRGDLFPQAIDFMGIHTAFEIQHPGARLAFRLGITQLRPRFGRLRLLFLLFLLRLMPLLLLRPSSSATASDSFISL
jgi:hypothetical protein